MTRSFFGPGISDTELKKKLDDLITEQPAPAVANTDHAISLTPSQAEVKSGLDAHGTKINEVINALKAAGIFL